MLTDDVWQRAHPSPQQAVKGLVSIPKPTPTTVVLATKPVPQVRSARTVHASVLQGNLDALDNAQTYPFLPNIVVHAIVPAKRDRFVPAVVALLFAQGIHPPCALVAVSM